MPSPPLPFTLTLVALCVVLFCAVVILSRKLHELNAHLSSEQSRQKSLSTTYGRITEQWFPLMPEYPYNPQYFRFLGSPIDGVQFESDRVVFVEFKANTSELTPYQNHLKRLIQDGQVFWEEFHFEVEDEREEEPP